VLKCTSRPERPANRVRSRDGRAKYASRARASSASSGSIVASNLFDRYLRAVTELGAVIPLGRLGLYKYTTMDSTLAMVTRLVRSLDDYLSGGRATRVRILRDVRGDWNN
jgi:hypothetical protein